MFLKQAFRVSSPAGKRGRLSILIFHRVLSVPDPLLPDLPDIQRFDQILAWLKDWFNVIPLGDAVARMKLGELPERTAAITFDDGYADNLVNATPVLKKHGLNATFFISTGFLDGGRMWNDTIIEAVRGAESSLINCEFLGLGQLEITTIEQKREALNHLLLAVKHLPSNQREDATRQISECSSSVLPNDLMLSCKQLIELRDAGMDIGAHTVSHPILSSIDDKIAHREISEGADYLRNLLGERIRVFAYPNGKFGRDYSDKHVEMVKALGFDAAVATNWGSSDSTSDLFQLPRFTPWDTARWRYGIRLLMNLRHELHQT
ncbi:MAG: polysaccharide deacetylase family protein [Propionivibrio sp.]|uniref:polysaccharide deacetylase family protein n=1 Tax=Propionivibrio sp. TaxID=2212460 RepID=UPI001A53F30E|nr:polysaccharide deacetylase family protein [Propionivibrio sp.]MBL8413621.1 polysaccharide deacetylase family protein [Propionivibrio sp.]